MATFVVVHGAWGGAWSWNKFVVPRLRVSGHTVFAATLTGLGDRTHLAHPGVDLDTHVQDVANVLFYEDLHDVILVGHSYGGRVITGVADTSADRLAHLVYLDAFVPTPENPQNRSWACKRRTQVSAETSLVSQHPCPLAGVKASASGMCHGTDREDVGTDTRGPGSNIPQRKPGPHPVSP